jgi:malate dehydrogenase (oxaloacetate-decarboxylating)(NADP+)
LITKSRSDLPKDDRKLRFAQDMSDMKDLLDIIKAVKPTTLIGLTGKGETFSSKVLQEMAKINEKPIILALSNPIPNSECTAEEVSFL